MISITMQNAQTEEQFEMRITDEVCNFLADRLARDYFDHIIKANGPVNSPEEIKRRNQFIINLFDENINTHPMLEELPDLKHTLYSEVLEALSHKVAVRLWSL